MVCARVVQDRQQIAAVQHDIRRSVPVAERFGKVQRRQLVRCHRAAQDQPPRQDPGREHLVEDAEPGEDASGVRRELQAGAQLGELRGALKDPDGDTGPGQRECG